MIGEFRMPALGADMDAGTLVEWLVEPGDAVRRGDIVAVVETQKGAIDVEIFQSGVIEALVVPVGEQVPVGTVLATLRVEGDEAAAVATPSPAPPAAAPTVPASTATPDAGRVSPRARRRAAELGIDPAAVTGTGPHGAVTAEDIERAAASRGAGALATAPSGMRQAIAAAMTRSNREIPHYYLGHDVDLEPALTWLEADNRDRPVRERVLPIALLVRAVAHGLSKDPALNGTFSDGRFVPGSGIHIGLVVHLRDGGLVVPAVRDADQGSLTDLWARIRDVTERARGSGLRASELTDATITVSSLGDRGVDSLFGVIHPPQVALVGFGTPASRPWVVDGAVVPRRVMFASLAADHRVTDGHVGARFLAHVARALAHPEDL